MEVVVNNTLILCDFVSRGILIDACEFNYVVSSATISNSSVVDRIILNPLIKVGKIRIEKIENLTYSELHYYTSNYGLRRYAYYEFHSIDIAKRQNLRLVTENSAIKQLAQAENIKILTVKQIKELLIRNINYEDVIKIKKSGNL